MAELPFVSCVCVTGKTPWHVQYMLPNAIKWFNEQTYPADRRELIIVHDGEGYELPPRPANVVEVATTRAALGAVRNRGLQRAVGDLIAQWDDDEVFHPAYLECLVSAQVARPAIPVFLKRELCYDFATDTACIRELGENFIHGSIVHPRTTASYPDQGREEDTAFLAAWPKKAIVDTDPVLKVHLSHGHNSWDVAHILRQFSQPWALGKWHVCPEHAAYLRRVLACYNLTSPSCEQGCPAGTSVSG